MFPAPMVREEDGRSETNRATAAGIASMPSRSVGACPRTMAACFKRKYALSPRGGDTNNGQVSGEGERVSGAEQGASENRFCRPAEPL